ncbi:MAG TPA: hypothetical protein VKS79_21725 [Gemmataceae bacterium]|nr:hypothetical protein [Gemmataceae bacterium]
MPRITILFGVLLIVYGIFTFVESVSKSPTAAMPAYFGVVLLILGVLALKSNLRKHAMHAAAAVGLIGVVGGLVMGASKLPALLTGSPALDEVHRHKAIAQNMLALICAIYVALCVNSFIQARVLRKKGTEAPSSTGNV